MHLYNQDLLKSDRHIFNQLTKSPGEDNFTTYYLRDGVTGWPTENTTKGQRPL